MTIEAVQWTGENYDEMRHFLPYGVRRFDVDGLHLNPLDLCLCQQTGSDGTVRWWFEKSHK